MYKIISMFLFLLLCVSLFSVTVLAAPIEVEGNWPAGVESSPRTVDISIKPKNNCWLIVECTQYPFYGHWGKPHYIRLWPFCWGPGGDTTPPFPHGIGVSPSRFFENGVSVKLEDAKAGSLLVKQSAYPLEAGKSYKGTLWINPPQHRNNAGMFQDQFKQYYKVFVTTCPRDGKDVPWPEVSSNKVNTTSSANTTGDSGKWMEVLFSGKTFTGKCLGDTGGQWPFKIKFTYLNKSSGTFQGEIEWTSLNAIHKIEGTISGKKIYFKETEYIKQGGAYLNIVYDLQYDSGSNSVKGTWYDPVHTNYYGTLNDSFSFSL
ncbi:MAG: hypothetical protein ABRQ39_26450 [Candidatus Eremiobacterota bacterium]